MSYVIPAPPNKWDLIPLMVPFGVMDDYAGADVPDNSGYAQFVKLTAGLTGAGQFNENLLTNESVSGSAPLVQATAEIDLADSPFVGETIRLWNTEGRYPKPGVNAGNSANDQMQRITGAVNSFLGGNSLGLLRNTSNLAGAFRSGGGTTQTVGSAGSAGAELDFDSAFSPNARTGSGTDVKHQELTYYVRIR